MLTGCGSIEQPTSLLALGNSITKYGENLRCGWTHDTWGLAAPSLEQDYAHITGNALGVPVTSMNVEIEYGLDVELPIGLPVDSRTDVVIEADDNAPAYMSPGDFGTEYGKLIALLGKPH